MTKEDNIHFARVDVDREKRCGAPETVFCPGKTSQQIADIMRSLKKANQNCMATRATEDQFSEISAMLPDCVWHDAAKAITLDITRLPPPSGLVTVVCAGTSDIPVAEEASLTASRMGARVEKVFDIGVAGLHRVMNHVELLKKSNAVVVVAGMEGALASVVAGLINRPVIAVPTSVGYGASLNGLSALLTMLNSCVPGITVVNIDNGFGGGTAAAMINRLACQKEEA
jgi:hypothetical protein